ncbi:MAG TPA: type III pantothenate kinase [Flavobacteriales bacterium]|nr:type III pantothenate kinase [Flavobacteriales bacterium]HRP81846.1 type III pantothenate kinase [Flavobacteriales bacterium]HRQ83975.1 type III pantothenate kinase [Flavobacteriales bacterium]
MMEAEQMDLVLDVGNSRMKMALFAQGRMVAHAQAAAGDQAAMARFVEGRNLVRTVIGSVGSRDQRLLEALQRLAPVRELTGASPSPVRSLYTTPSTFGVDRLANVVGAAALYPRRPVLAIDLGSCITYDLVDQLALHHGGIISPGLHMRARAMHAFSARLPLVEPPDQPPVLGASTHASLASGIIHGAAMEVKGFAAELARQHPGLAVVVTGGDALRAAWALKSGIFVHPTLTLIGLHALSQYDPALGPAAPR